MRNLPTAIIHVLRPFARAFSDRVWQWAISLLLGTMLAPGKRTVTAALRVMGLRGARQFQKYHRGLNRATWSSRRVSQILVRLLIRAWVPPEAPSVLGLDDHIERRRGAKLAATGIQRDAVRSSTSFFVTTRGLRGVSMLLVTTMPWAHRGWAVPCLTVRAPSARQHQARGMRHKQVTDWARHMITHVRRWLADRHLVVTAASPSAALALLAACHALPQPVTLVTRLRLDAALYDPAPVREAGTRGAPRTKGARQPSLAQRVHDPATPWEEVTVRWQGGTTRQVDRASGTAVGYHSGLPVVPSRWVLIRDPLAQVPPPALLSSDLRAAASQIGAWLVLRWQREVTLEEARAHLGIATQRQGSELALQRTTPAVLGLFALVPLVAHHLLQAQDRPVRHAAWYQKPVPTCSDTLAFVRQHLWASEIFWMSSVKPDIVTIPQALFDRLMDTLAFAA